MYLSNVSLQLYLILSDKNMLADILFPIQTVLPELLIFLGTAGIFLKAKNIFKLHRTVYIFAAIFTAVILYDQVFSYLLFPQEFDIINIMLVSPAERVDSILRIIVPAIIFARERYLHPKERSGELFTK
jgi:hypothetical protein